MMLFLAAITYLGGCELDAEQKAEQGRFYTRSVSLQDRYDDQLEHKVAVLYAVLKKEPRHFSENIGPIKYGQQALILSKQDDWVTVKVAEKEGFVHASALRPVLKVVTSPEFGEDTEKLHKREFEGEYKQIEETVIKNYEYKYSRKELEERISKFKSLGKLK